MEQPTKQSITHRDAPNHVRGTTAFLDDLTLLQGTNFAAVFDSPKAHAIIKKLDLTEAEKMPGVVRIFTAADIPGQNQIGGIIPDEPLLAEDEVHFCGMPIALVVADTESHARAALKKIKLELQELPIITDERMAFSKGELIVPPRTFKMGDTQAAWQTCTHIFEGQTYTNGQEHLYLETQAAYAIPTAGGGLKVYSSTQGPTLVQRTIAAVLNLPMHLVEIETGNLGGGFGGKEDQATGWAVLAALAAFHLKKPIKLCLHRMDDMRMTGKRHPYSANYKIGLDAALKIKAYEVSFYQNAGAAADLSPAVLERTLFHCTNAYFIPNVLATAYSCRTNLPPNTAFRGFGGPQGMFVIEAAIAHAANQLNIPANHIQEKNLNASEQEFPYGQKAESEAQNCWKELKNRYEYEACETQIMSFNEQHTWQKKGMAIMPICFGISFTKTRLNQASSLVHIYLDGSVSVSTGAVEMGQGVNSKIAQVAAHIFNLDIDKIKVQSTNTFRNANTSPSAASATADLNGKATQLACEALLQRLLDVAAKKLKVDTSALSIQKSFVFNSGKQTPLSFKELVQAAYDDRVSLSELKHYTPEGIYFDASIEKGHPFAYHVYGAALVEVTIDCLRGNYTIDSVKVVHDVGKSMNPVIDRGQCEGGIVQGIGWMTLEEIIYDTEGRLKSNALSTYKVPDIYAAPRVIDVHFLESERPNKAIMGSKAVGEPPLMYGIGAYFALRNAVLAFNPNAALSFHAPLTPEKLLMALYS